MRYRIAVLLVLAAVPAAAQGPDPIRGYVIDLRGTTTGLPKDTAFFPGIPVETIVPARGFGFELGGHVYLLTLGPSRVGLGATYVRARGTTEGIAATVSTVAPQVSFNFGTAAGWSYLSAGLGAASVSTTATSETGTIRADTESLSSVNYGGGARWFLARRLAVGFDLRLHQLSGPPKTTLFAASVGFSIR